jgi:nucleotide-binding universal stress UspA family protein
MFQRILLSLDAGDAGDVATSFTVALARRCNAAVHVVHVHEYALGGRGLTSESPAHAAGIVADALRELHAAGVDASGITYRTTSFDVAAAISDLAEQCRADVIVLGSRRRRFASFLRRSTRERISRLTPLPIVTAPAPLRVDVHDPTLRAAPLLLDQPVRS